MRTGALAAALLAAASLAASATAKDARTARPAIGPGATAVTDEEKSVQSDPAAGTQHALILLEETECNEDFESTFRLAYHMRAKILSNEGRDLANVAVPKIKRNWTLETWWGRTMLPDGPPAELGREGLHEQTEAKYGSDEYLVLKGVLPGVEPGAVIDYGYVLTGHGNCSYAGVSLQRPFAIKSLAYRWIPYHGSSGRYAIRGSQMKAVDVRVEDGSILVKARDMKPVPDEPFMPPDSEVRTTVSFYYSRWLSSEGYWASVGGWLDRLVSEYGPNDKSLRLALSQMTWPPGADLDAKIRHVYDWIGRNVRNSVALSAEEVELVGKLGTDKKFNARALLAERYGSPGEINILFASFVRALGADAQLVYAVDRNKGYWNPEIQSLGQFSYVFVAVKMRGDPDDKAVVVDAASGLPYGDLPWQATGTHAVVGGVLGFRPVALLPSMSDKNVGDTTVALAFDGGGDVLTARWGFRGVGQQGREQRASIRRVSGDDRAKRLGSMCASAGWEARVSEAPDVDDRTAPFRLACEIESEETHFDASLDSYTLTLAGPWWPQVPDFPAATREQPVVFPYPRTDVVHADIAAPPGFRAGDPPPSIRMDTQIGSYRLDVTATDGGLHVERTMVIKPLKVMPQGYSLVKSFFEDVARADRTPLTFKRAPAAP